MKTKSASFIAAFIILLMGCQTSLAVDDSLAQAKGISNGDWINIAAGDQAMPSSFWS